jgi:hypothetical protein
MLSEELGIMTQVSELFLISLETKKSYTRDSSPAGTDLFISFAHASLGFAITFQAYSCNTLQNDITTNECPAYLGVIWGLKEKRSSSISSRRLILIHSSRLLLHYMGGI